MDRFDGNIPDYFLEAQKEAFEKAVSVIRKEGKKDGLKDLKARFNQLEEVTE